MSAETQTGSIAGEPAGSSPEKLRTGLVTLLFTDIVGSVALKQQLGDRPAARFIEAHHELVRQTLREVGDGKEIETAGDSFLIMFTTPSEAVTFALQLQGRLWELNREQAVPVLDRLGIHLGEVVIREHAEGLKPRDLYGSNVDICARVMSLAKGGQVLMSRGVFDSARQVLKGEDIEGVGQLEWLNHGPYLLKGLDEPVEICEVREASQKALSPPTSSEKAQRQVRPDEEPVLGWRPAVGQRVPNTKWVLEQKLGEGGFGEVWLGRQQTTKEHRVFKFCFQAERVRFLKRELTLFRVLKERVGDHPNIVRLHDVYLDQPPFYVEMDYVEGSDLRSWCEAQGGVENVPLEARLEIVAQAADGLQAAHEAGIIHRDIKPANILIQRRSRREEAHISSGSDGGRQKSEPPHVGCDGVLVKLTDFGIGQVVSEESLAGITRAGFTQTILGSSSTSHTGTQLYMAPELVASKPASTRSDIYSLGVVLYQLLVGDFSQPVTTDWGRQISDSLLREDLGRCFAGDPNERFGSAAELAKHLRALPERRAALEKQQAEIAARERAAYRRGMMRTAGVAAVIVAVIAGLALVTLQQSRQAKAAASAETRERVKATQAAQAERQQRQRAEASDRESQHLLYVANMHVAQEAGELNNVGRLRELLEQTARYPVRGFEWYYWQRQMHLELQTLRGHSSGVCSVAFSPDGQRIVTGSWDGTAKVWEAASGKPLLTLKGHTPHVHSVAFSPDNKRIVTGLCDGMTKVWDVASGKRLLTLKGHNDEIGSVAFSLDGKRIATGGGLTAKVWDVASGKLLRTLEGHDTNVTSVAFSPDGQRIVTGSDDETAKVWDAASGSLLLTLKGHPTEGDYIRSVAFSPDGQRIVTGSWQGTAKVWDVASAKEVLALKGHGAPFYSVVFSADGQRIVTGCGDGTAMVWDAASGKELLTFKGHTGGVLSVAISPDGQRIVTGSEDLTAKVWEVGSRKEVLTLNEAIFGAAFSPDGEQIVTGCVNGSATVWDAASGKELLTLKGPRAMIITVAFSPDGHRIVTGSSDQTGKVWEAATGNELFALKGHSDQIYSAAFSPDGQRIVTGSVDHTAMVWDAATGKELLTFRSHADMVNSVAFSPDGQRIASGSDDGTTRVWDAASGTELLRFNGQSQSVAFSPDGQRIVTGCGDGTALVWDAASGKELLKFKGHSAMISSVAFSPDGQRIVTGSYDQAAKVWEASTGKDLLTLRGHTKGIWSVAFSPDGQRILTGSLDHTARVWEAATAQQVAAWGKEERESEEHLAALRREQAAAAQQEQALRAEDPGAIKQWLVLAPIRFEGRSEEAALQALDQEQIAHEANLRPRAGDRAKVGESEQVWKVVPTEDALLDFNHFLGEQTDWSVAYAVSYIQSDAEWTGLLMKVGSDDEAKVYLNGKEIYRNEAGRACVPDEDEVTGVELKAGLNVVVFKVVNETLGWQGSIHFTDAAGQPIKGIRVMLAPP